MNGKTKLSIALRIVAELLVAAIAIGGWCYALGQRSSDTTIEKRVSQLELKQATWESRWDERWERILEELKAIHSQLAK